MTISTERLREAAQLADSIWADLDDVRRQTNLTDAWAGTAEEAGRRIIAFAEASRSGVERREAVGAVADIAAERRRQVEAEGWTPEHDDRHADGALALAAAAYAYASQYPEDLRSVGGRPNWWPWDASWWKPKDRRRDLVRAGALIAAEIDRLDRRTLKDNTHGA